MPKGIKGFQKGHGGFITRSRFKKGNHLHACQLCHITEGEHKQVFGRVLAVHHINYNKYDYSQDNLVVLCQACNSRVNFNKRKWRVFFEFDLPFVIGRNDGKADMFPEKAKELMSQYR